MTRADELRAVLLRDIATDLTERAGYVTITSKALSDFADLLDRQEIADIALHAYREERS